jgi:hypothetical protein
MKRVDKNIDPEKVFRALLQQEGILQPEAEYVFAAPRRWRFDYCWTAYKVALEVEGGVWVRGRHNRGAGYLNDLEKYSEAAILGWCVLRLTPRDLLRTGAELVARALTCRGYHAPAVAAPAHQERFGVAPALPASAVSIATASRKLPVKRSVRGASVTPKR